jgi:hybrid cluster-associated redox disulfide protein
MRRIMASRKNTSTIIKPTTKISEIAKEHPEAIELLVTEYDFHCIGCSLAQYETLEEGAHVHGIEGKNFTELLEKLEKVSSLSKLKSSSRKKRNSLQTNPR